nr:DnaB-like helicase C-terminal domain-containing protein [Brevibacterium sp. 68QC2CO]
MVQAVRMSATAGKPISVPYGNFSANGVCFRRGEFTLVAAGPGSGKSALMLNMLQRGNGHGHVHPTVYFSADSGPAQVFQRSATIACNNHGYAYDMAGVEQIAKDEGGHAWLEDLVRQDASHIRYSFDSTLTTDGIMDELESYGMVYGEWPEVIVIDNLMNVDAGSGEEFTDLNEASFFLNDLARDTNAAVIALHHVGGQHEDGDKPIPLGGLRGKVSKLPSMILTLHRVEDEMKVSVVKNRAGRAQADGGWGVELQCNLAYMAFRWVGD